MTCTEYQHNLWVCRTPMETIATEREEPRWCFGCRKRLAGTWACKATVEPSYYDPYWEYACDGCGEDRRHGFGYGPL